MRPWVGRRTRAGVRARAGAAQAVPTGGWLVRQRTASPSRTLARVTCRGRAARSPTGGAVAGGQGRGRSRGKAAPAGRCRGAVGGSGGCAPRDATRGSGTGARRVGGKRRGAGVAGEGAAAARGGHARRRLARTAPRAAGAGMPPRGPAGGGGERPRHVTCISVRRDEADRCERVGFPPPKAQPATAKRVLRGRPRGRRRSVDSATTRP